MTRFKFLGEKFDAKTEIIKNFKRSRSHGHYRKIAQNIKKAHKNKPKQKQIFCVRPKM